MTELIRTYSIVLLRFTADMEELLLEWAKTQDSQEGPEAARAINELVNNVLDDSEKGKETASIIREMVGRTSEELEESNGEGFDECDSKTVYRDNGIGFEIFHLWSFTIKFCITMNSNSSQSFHR